MEGVEEERWSVWMVVVGEEVREEGAACAPDRSNAHHARVVRDCGMPLSKRRHVDTSGTPDGTTRFRLLRTCRTCEDAFSVKLARR